MTLSKVRYLLDVSVLVALLDEDHINNRIMTEWFNVHDRQWAICCFTEAGFLRYATRSGTANASMSEAMAMLNRVTHRPGYHYQAITAEWHTLCSPFFPRLYGTKQVTDAFLLGLAVQEGLVLVTMDKGIVHLAGEHKDHVLLLTERQERLQ